MMLHSSSLAPSGSVEPEISAEQRPQTWIQDLIQQEGWFHGRWVINISVPKLWYVDSYNVSVPLPFTLNSRPQVRTRAGRVPAQLQWRLPGQREQLGLWSVCSQWYGGRHRAPPAAGWRTRTGKACGVGTGRTEGLLVTRKATARVFLHVCVQVRTHDQVFLSIGHLVRFHMENQLPIVSGSSKLFLKQPILKH